MIGYQQCHLLTKAENQFNANFIYILSITAKLINSYRKETLNCRKVPDSMFKTFQ